jgi:hypothetical protein
LDAAQRSVGIVSASPPSLLAQRRKSNRSPRHQQQHVMQSKPATAARLAQGRARCRYGRRLCRYGRRLCRCSGQLISWARKPTTAPVKRAAHLTPPQCRWLTEAASVPMAHQGRLSADGSPRPAECLRGSRAPMAFQLTAEPPPPIMGVAAPARIHRRFIAEPPPLSADGTRGQAAATHGRCPRPLLPPLSVIDAPCPVHARPAPHLPLPRTAHWLLGPASAPPRLRARPRASPHARTCG